MTRTRTQADELADELDTNRAALEQAREQISEQQEQLDKQETDRQQLEASLATAREEQSQARSRASELTEELATTRTALEQARDQIAQRKAALDEVAAERQSVAEQYRQAREQLALQQAESRDASETIAELKGRLQREHSAMDNLQTRLQALSEERQTLVSQLKDGTTVIKLPENIVFNSGSARIGEAGRQTLQLLANALESFPDHTISVQGHTDSRPISPSLQSRYPTNWELSASRATSAVRVLREQGIAADRMQAVGYADTRPLVSETDAASRRINGTAHRSFR
jgi:chemotaxis protein MotB